MNNQNLPCISVIVPTCHRNDLLAKCLDCLAPGVQTLPAEQYEVVVTDDGSRSTAEQMIREQYPWAKWVPGPRRGPAANRNHGAKQARGEWLVFTDDDCLPSPQWLIAYSQAIKPDVHVYEGKTTCKAGINSPIYEAPVNLTGGCLWSCNFMVGAGAFEAVNGFDDSFIVPGGEDIDFRSRLAAAGYQFPFVDEAIVDHPPRRSRWGGRSGALWESQVLLWQKAGPRKLLPMRLIIQAAKVRTKTLLQHPLQRDTLLALVSLVIEVGYILQHVRAWQAKHATAR